MDLNIQNLETEKSTRTLKIFKHEIHPLSENRKTIKDSKLNVNGLN